MSHSRPANILWITVIEVVAIEGKGRGVVATQDFKNCELVLLAPSLAAAVVEDEYRVAVTLHKNLSWASQAKVAGMLVHVAATDNETSWCMSQLSAGPDSTRPVVQMSELSGLSPRWLPLLGQHPNYYPVWDGVVLDPPTIAAVVDINLHGVKRQPVGSVP